MKSRRVFLAAAAVAAGMAAWFFFRPVPVPIVDKRGPETIVSTDTRPGAAVPPQNTAPGAAASHLPRAAVITPHTGNSRATPGAAAGSSTGAENAIPPDPQAEAEKVRGMITDYHTLMHENPVGTNAEIMHALMGGNARQAVLGPPEGQSLNARGELVDLWGTPYFFHQLSRDHMEIHSAGPDKIMGTDDDVVLR